MRPGGCQREEELLALLQRGAWPTAAADLLAHVAGCARCSEVLRVKSALMASRTDGMAEARLEAPGVLWWKAQVRRRYAAQRRLEQPVLRAQMFALLVGLAAGLGLLAANGSFVLDRLKQMPEIGAEWSTAWSGPGWELALAVGAVAMLCGVVLYLAAERA